MYCKKIAIALLREKGKLKWWLKVINTEDGFGTLFLWLHENAFELLDPCFVLFYTKLMKDGLLLLLNHGSGWEYNSNSLQLHICGEFIRI